ncbi:hypothetical protein P170DRAFT_407754 [Aspergillus steynii IBT 23096]|uniref:C3H1-type domain-containing protein n=1 Tax=Aspergillus steynii IBT 23096 TaxID=1392250 RepID=A0A2I2G7S4_9EURO|nr:uncharacterized protein P170DRAFT_407754 [Aspergillus steynii IBT 23096]PLB48937.1 hypothetical protein P170DRAFT_407754 [Aspergillus steynii IBT 23096]
MTASLEELVARFDKYSRLDIERADLIQSLLEKTRQYEARFENLQIELEHERESRTRYQLDLRELREQKRALDYAINKEPYVAVLVDGDGAIFNDEFLRDPQNGAPEAALQLRQAVRSYLRDSPLGTEQIPIIVRVYVNLNGLAKSLCSAKVIELENHMRLFADLFTNSRAEFDFVNVGHGKENADSKMRKMLTHYYNNFQCKKIFFAGCHDNGYLHELREYEGDFEAKQRIVLLETTPAQPAFTSLKFAMTRFDTVFRSEPLQAEPRRNLSPTAMKPATTLASPPPAQPPSTMPFPSPSIASPMAPAPVQSPTQESVASSGNGGFSIKYPTGTSLSYASAGGANGHQNISIASAKPKPPRIIDYNENGQRIDPPNKFPSNPVDQQGYRDKLESIRPKAFCNGLYLVGRCERPGSCPMEHTMKLTPGELAVHRYKARTTLCPNGPECENYYCYLSHHCPHGLNCMRRGDCKFNGTVFGDLHHSSADMETYTRWTEGNDFPVHL